MPIRRLLALLLLPAIAACAATPEAKRPARPGAAPVAAPAPLESFGSVGTIELLGAVDLPVGLTFEGEPVGGLSGLLWEADTGRFLALSDDASERAPARFYELEIELEEGRLGPGGVRIAGRVRLTDREGEPFERGTLDPEGFARTRGGDLVVGSEGVRTHGSPPALLRFRRDGREIERLELPERYRLDAEGARGPRANESFEALAVTPGGTLVAGLESALVQDGPRAGPGIASPSRLLLRDLEGSRPDRELVYRVDPIAGSPASDDAFRVNGLVDLLVLSEERLLALEREYVAGAGNRIRLLEVELAGATDVAGLDGEPTDARPVRKRLVVDLAELGVELDNFEALALGPELADGRRLLVVLSDDNFNPAEQRTRIVALAVSDGAPSIGAIQGADHRSPLAGRWAAGVEGIVTAVDPRAKPPAFFLQAERADADPATADAIRVVASGALPRPGDRVRVVGRVEEIEHPRQLPVTTLRSSGIELLGEGSPLPEPRRVTARDLPPRIDDDRLESFDPAADAIDFWESLEGLRVELPAGTVTGPTLAYGELVLALDDGLPRTPAGGLLLAPDGPPLARAIVGGRLAGGLPELAVGARLDGPVVGVVDYSFSNYKVLATAPVSGSPGAPSAGARCGGSATRLGPAPSALTLATLNVENLSFVDAEERFALAGRVIARELRAPAIVALEEIQDDSGRARGDGVVTARRTLERLVEAIVAAGGPRYRPVSIDPELDREGGVPGGNIRVALLVDPARVGFEPRGEAGPRDATEPVGRGEGLHLSLNPGRVEPESEPFSLEVGEGVRRSLAVELAAGGRPLFVIANHWSSKFDDDRAFGAAQPPAKPTAAKRLAQARIVRGFVERLLEADPDARVVVLGDLNDFPWSPAVEEISRPPLENLLLRLPAEERYTYNFEGVSHALDYVLVTPPLAGGAEIEPLHRNSDCPDAVRSSDHDPVVARLKLPS